MAGNLNLLETFERNGINYVIHLLIPQINKCIVITLTQSYAADLSRMYSVLAESYYRGNEKNIESRYSRLLMIFAFRLGHSLLC